MTLSKREKIVATLAGVVLGALLLDQVILSPYLDRLKKADELILSHQDKQTAATSLFQNDLNAKRRWKELAGNNLKSDASAAEGQLLDRVRDAAQSSRMQVQSMKPERSERMNGFMRITIRVSASGSMSNMTRFISALQTSSIPLRISDLQISSRKDGTDDLVIQIGVATIYEAPPAPRVARINDRTEALQ